MNIRLFFLFFLFSISSVAISKKITDEVPEKLILLEKLKKEYRLSQEKLQVITEKRWALRQLQVEKQERNKIELDNLRSDIDRIHTDLARSKEEKLAREQALSIEEQHLSEKISYTDILEQSISDKLDNFKKENETSFPIDREHRMAKLNIIENRFNSKKQYLQLNKALTDYFIQNIEKSSQININRQSILTDTEKSVSAQVLRIGNVCAYALNPDGLMYMLSSTGQSGKNGFSWINITHKPINDIFLKLFPEIIETGKISSSIPFDIIQNKSSRSLLEGKKRSRFHQTWQFINKGGVTMIPLGAIVLWALWLIISRFFYYMGAHNHDYRFINNAIKLLEKGENEKAKGYAQKEKGGLARVLQTCLEHCNWDRKSAELAVRELLLAEFPKLDKHLDTLAALAGAAPLLGLLGTVTGMIQMFEAITRFGTADPQLLAGGISEALVTTMVGLTIAIPLLLIHTLLCNTRGKIQSDMELYSMSILNRLWP